MLAESLAARRVLFVATYRPGSHPPWLDHSYATQVALAPLDRQASVAMVSAVLGVASDETLVNAIVDRAEGNPFFLEELAVAVRRDAALGGGPRARHGRGRAAGADRSARAPGADRPPVAGGNRAAGIRRP